MASSESLKNGRVIFLDGGTLEDVTRHPAFRNVVATSGALYDFVSDPSKATGKAKAQSAPAPARFFTINEIIAKQDARRSGATGKVAAVERPSSLSDAPGTRSGRGPEPFGMFAFKAPDDELWTKWRRLEKDLA
jgi:hypothetical protein